MEHCLPTDEIVTPLQADPHADAVAMRKVFSSWRKGHEGRILMAQMRERRSKKETLTSRLSPPPLRLPPPDENDVLGGAMQLSESLFLMTREETQRAERAEQTRAQQEGQTMATQSQATTMSIFPDADYSVQAPFRYPHPWFKHMLGCMCDGASAASTRAYSSAGDAVLHEHIPQAGGSRGSPIRSAGDT